MGMITPVVSHVGALAAGGALQRRIADKVFDAAEWSSLRRKSQRQHHKSN